MNKYIYTILVSFSIFAFSDPSANVQLDDPNIDYSDSFIPNDKSASDVLNPILSLFPGLHSIHIKFASECPKPTIDVFARNILLESHCIVFDPVKPIIRSVMAFAWLLSVLFIVLSA